MRLFVSLRPPPQVCAHLAAAVTGVRTTRVDQWHLTLAFLGEVPSAAPLSEPLSAAAATAPVLSLQLTDGGFFPGPGVLFAGVSGDVDGLRSLAADVGQACRSAGVHLERRAYRPHLTVARRLRADPGVLVGYAGPTWSARGLELVRSRLDGRVEHEVLARHAFLG